jgi:DNA-binding Xre family transcriptional regulator
MSMVRVAHEAGISVETLRKIEGGQVPTPTFFTIGAICDVLDISLDTVISDLRTRETAGETAATN